MLKTMAVAALLSRSRVGADKGRLARVAHLQKLRPPNWGQLASTVTASEAGGWSSRSCWFAGNITLAYGPLSRFFSLPQKHARRQVLSPAGTVCLGQSPHVGAPLTGEPLR